MKTWILGNKEKTTLVIAIVTVVWFFGSFIPKQNCLYSISLKFDSDSNYRYGGKYFKTTKDALNHCMAERWIF